MIALQESPMRARMLLAGGKLDTAKLRIVWAASIAWGKIAPGIGSNPEAIEAARMKLANKTLQAIKGLDEFDAAGLADIVVQLCMPVQPN
jgi:hypothetical protein